MRSNPVPTTNEMAPFLETPSPKHKNPAHSEATRYHHRGEKKTSRERKKNENFGRASKKNDAGGTGK